MRGLFAGAVCILAFVLVAPRAARADAESGLAREPTGCGFKNAVFTQPLAWTGRGASLAYERFVAPPTWSLVGLAGVRSAAQGDYSSYTVDGAVEARAWLPGPRIPRCPQGSMSGPYFGLRVDVGYTGLHDNVVDRGVGGQVSIDPTLLFGYRFVLFELLETTPWFGLGGRTAIDTNGGAPWFRPTLALGWSIGWVF